MKTVRRLLAVLILTLAVVGSLGTARADRFCLQTLVDQHKPTICVPMP
jgi:hypothetical protein